MSFLKRRDQQSTIGDGKIVLPGASGEQCAGRVGATRAIKGIQKSKGSFWKARLISPSSGYYRSGETRLDRGVGSDKCSGHQGVEGLEDKKTESLALSA